jgi:hypothetical protein
MSSSLSVSEEFMLKDSSSSDFDSDLEHMLSNDDVEQMMVIITVMNLQDRLRMKMRHRSIAFRL